MSPVFRKGARGKAFVRVPEAFYCIEHDLMARGRAKPRLTGQTKAR
jgi:hypothetical protein